MKITDFSDFQHAIRTVNQLTGEEDVYLIGSQAAYGMFGCIPVDNYETKDFDIIFIYRDGDDINDKESLLFCVGEDSHFDQEYGFYLDPVDPQNIMAPEGWEDRSYIWQGDCGNGRIMTVRCMDIADVCACKVHANRPKDRKFVFELLDKGIVSGTDIFARLGQLPISFEQFQQYQDRLTGIINGEI